MDRTYSQIQKIGPRREGEFAKKGTQHANATGSEVRHSEIHANPRSVERDSHQTAKSLMPRRNLAKSPSVEIVMSLFMRSQGVHERNGARGNGRNITCKECASDGKNTGTRGR